MARELKEATPILLPQNLDAEESVLGAMMISPNVISAIVEKLHEDDFYLDSQRLIFRTIIELFNIGEPVDPITVTEKLSASGAIEKVGGKSYIHTLVSTVPAPSSAKYYANIVRENSLLRSLIEVGNRISALGYERPGETTELLNESERLVFDISQRQVRGEIQPLSKVLVEQFEKIEKLQQEGKKITGLPTGFHDLDAKTSGFQNSSLIILAARPAMGKTSLALDIAQHVAIKENIPVLLFSLEMGQEELAQRMMCTQGRIDSHKLRTGQLKSGDDWAKLTDACNRLSKAPIFIDDASSISMLEVMAKTRRLASQHPNLGLVIIDYLQLMSPEGRVQNREQEIAKISRSLKIMAKELKIPVVALSQLNRSAEGRHPPRPILPDLRESGALEQDADMVLFIYRPKDQETGHLENTAELLIAKHRNGPTGTVDLVFNNTYASFGSAARI